MSVYSQFLLWKFLNVQNCLQYLDIWILFNINSNSRKCFVVVDNFTFRIPMRKRTRTLAPTRSMAFIDLLASLSLLSDPSRPQQAQTGSEQTGFVTIVVYVYILWVVAFSRHSVGASNFFGARKSTKWHNFFLTLPTQQQHHYSSPDIFPRNIVWKNVDMYFKGTL